MVGKFYKIEKIPYRGFQGFSYTNNLFDGCLYWNFIDEETREIIKKYLEVLNS